MGRKRLIRLLMKRAFVFACLLFLSAQQALFAHPGAHEALQHFSREIKAHPRQQSLYIQRGIAYSNDGQFPQAQADFERAAELGDPALVGFDFGVLYYRMADFDSARRYFDGFLQRYPNHAACLEYRARLLRDAGEYEASVADFRRVFELQQHPNPGHYISTARMLQSGGPDGIEQALEILDQGNKKLGLTPQLQRYAIQLELSRQQPENALQRMRELEPILGDSPDWKVDMGELLLQVRQPEQAAALLEAASQQLDTLRSTPARLQTREKIARLRATETLTTTH
jgi:predicted Zn-dependent protease